MQNLDRHIPLNCEGLPHTLDVVRFLGFREHRHCIIEARILRPRLNEQREIAWFETATYIPFGAYTFRKTSLAQTVLDVLFLITVSICDVGLE